MMNVDALIEQLKSYKTDSFRESYHPEICDDSVIAISVLKKENDKLQGELGNVKYSLHSYTQDIKENERLIEELEGKLEEASKKIHSLEHDRCKVDKIKLFEAMEDAVTAYENANIFNTEAIRECIKPILNEVSKILGIEAKQ